MLSLMKSCCLKLTISDCSEVNWCGIPNEKKSTAGAADTFAGSFRGAPFGLPPSSTDIFDRPLASDGGKKEKELDVSTEAGAVLSSLISSRLVVGSSSKLSIARGAAAREVLNTNPGPFPPPKTRSGAGSAATFCFGAGSIDNSDDAPAPDSSRGFFAAGLSSLKSSSSLSPAVDRLGSPIVIFFGPPFVVLGGGS